MPRSNPTTGPARELSIALTLVKDAGGSASMTIRVEPRRIITYDQQLGFTRLRLTGHKVLDVKEGTDQIDHLIRVAASDPARQNQNGQSERPTMKSSSPRHGLPR